MLMKDGEAVTEFTPGEHYTIESAAYVQIVNLWLHATAGTLSPMNPDLGEATHALGDYCDEPESAAFSLEEAESHTFGWDAPDTADCVTFSVAQATGMLDNYHTATVRAAVSCYLHIVSCFLCMKARLPH